MAGRGKREGGGGRLRRGRCLMAGDQGKGRTAAGRPAARRGRCLMAGRGQGLADGGWGNNGGGRREAAAG